MPTRIDGDTCVSWCFWHKLAHRNLLHSQMRPQSCASAFMTGWSKWVTYLTRSMTRSLGAALTGSSLIITIWSPGISLPSEGPPENTQEWSAVEKTIHKPTKIPSIHHDSMWAGSAISQDKAQSYLGVLWISLRSQAALWPIKSETLGVRLMHLHFLKLHGPDWDLGYQYFPHFNMLMNDLWILLPHRGIGWDHAFLPGSQQLLMLLVKSPANVKASRRRYLPNR